MRWAGAKRGDVPQQQPLSLQDPEGALRAADRGAVHWVPGLGGLQEERREERVAGTKVGRAACGAWRAQVWGHPGRGWCVDTRSK